MFGIGVPELIILLFIVFPIYFAPAVVAFSRGHKSAGGILFLNLLFGWTLLVWVGCFIWAFSGQGSRYRGSVKQCPACLSIIPAQATKCRHCAEDVSTVVSQVTMQREWTCSRCGCRNRMQDLNCMACNSPMMNA